MIYKVATLEDKDICFELLKKNLEATTYRPFFTDDDLRKQIDIWLNSNRFERLALLFFDEDKTVGLASFELLPSYSDVKIARLTTAYIEPEYRKKGLMKEIREAFEHWAKQVGCSFCNIGIAKEEVDLTKNGYMKYEVMYVKDIR